MPIVIRIVDVPGRVVDADKKVSTGQYVETYDVEAFDGRGTLTTTASLQHAFLFEDLEVAVRAWQQVPRCRPKRPDGRPNRPLTTFTIELIPVEQLSTGEIRVTTNG